MNNFPKTNFDTYEEIEDELETITNLYMLKEEDREILREFSYQIGKIKSIGRKKYLRNGNRRKHIRL